MTNLLVLGGTGRTGKHVLAQAVERGHHVRALVRNPSVAVPTGVELIVGTPSNIDDLRKAAVGTEAVISALNSSRTSDNPWAKPISPPGFLTDVARNVLAVMNELGMRRVVLASAFGTADDWQRLNPLFRAFIQMSNLKAVWDDQSGLDRVVRASSTDWTLPRALMLTDKPVGHEIRAADGPSVKPGSSLYRGDFARFMLEAVEDGKWIGKAPLVWNA
jgi:uncharacterized protein YbjT (DUF2867 family)